MISHIPYGSAPKGKSQFLFTDHPTMWKSPQEKSNEVYYICNNDGYREREWHTINWFDYVLFLGDSATFGLGVKQNETIPYFVEKLYNKTCVNLSIPGTNLEVITQLSLLLVKQTQPHAVVIQYPHLQRLYDPIIKQFHGNLGTWTNDYDGIPQNSKDLYNTWIKEPYRAELKANFYANILRHLWSKIKLVEWSWDNDVSTLLDLPTFESIPQKPDDLSRDGIHANAHLNQIVARNIINAFR